MGGSLLSATFFSVISANPIIAAVKNVQAIDAAAASGCGAIFLLTGSIFNLKDLVEKGRGSGKSVYVHLDLLDGFSKDLTALKYIHEHIKPDGMITTRPSLARKAAEMQIFIIQRLFIFDSLSRQTAVSSVKDTKINAIEILPGIMPRTIRQITGQIKIPLIAGGLFEEKKDVIQSLEAGAIGVSTSNQALWEL
jgi:glycerol uptake operon antiterminator